MGKDLLLTKPKGMVFLEGRMEFLESLNRTVMASSLHSRGLFKPRRDDGVSRLWSQRSPRSNLHVLGDQVQSFLFLMTQCIYSLSFKGQ